MSANIASSVPESVHPSGSRTNERVATALNGHDPLADIPALLAFEAPYLERRLLRLGVAVDEDQARRLFQELKKYLLVSELHRDRRIDMFSVRVDEAWHQFALFTREYAEFCARFFGHFVHHCPTEAPAHVEEVVREVMHLEEFRRVYEACFGAFADEWFDERGLTADTRLCRAPWADPLRLDEEAGRAVLRCTSEQEQAGVLCRVNLRAAAALSFLVGHRRFFIRELPGLANASERIELCRPLIQFKILRVAP